MKAIPYIGNGPYCYANSVAMLLDSIGESISPAKVEVLSGVGIGACLLTKDKLLFFNTYAGAPDTGISRALEILGFNYEEKSSERSDFNPFDQLRKNLNESPVVLGPLDMGYLKYNPRSESLYGVDHFVLVYGIDNNNAYFHDPAGFPCVSIPIKDLAEAWKAENIGYRRNYYRYWTKPARVKQPKGKEIYDQAIQFFRSLYQESHDIAVKEKRVIDNDAIMTIIERLKNGNISSIEKDHLTHFALPLGAKRALDFASFFSPHNAVLTDLKQKQAQLFGRCHALVMNNDWKESSKSLEEFATVEKEFRNRLMN